MPKRLLAAALCLYTLVVTSGVPLPLAGFTALSLPASDSADPAERFPCEACPCGCGTAEHCWNRCCCHTLPQRLAWARREGVRPPDEVIQTARDAGLDVSLWTGEPSPIPKPVRTTVVEAPTPPLDELPPCCRRRLEAERQAESQAPREQEKKTKPAPGVALLQALACQGVAEAWLALGEAPTPSPVALIDDRPTAPAHKHAVMSHSPETEAPTPPPPERRVASLS